MCEGSATQCKASSLALVRITIGDCGISYQKIEHEQCGGGPLRDGCFAILVRKIYKMRDGSANLITLQEIFQNHDCTLSDSPMQWADLGPGADTDRHRAAPRRGPSQILNAHAYAYGTTCYQQSEPKQKPSAMRV